VNLSVCYILKNEEEWIERSLQSVRGIASEILIQDHGSTDRSLEIIAALQIPQLQIFKATWRDDFAWARNEIAQKAKASNWVLFMDGDEVLDEASVKHLKDALAKPDRVFSLIQRNYTKDSALSDLHRCEASVPGLESTEGVFYFDNWMERIYKPSSGCLYEGRIHESLIPSAHALKIPVERLPLILHHFGRLKSGHSKKLVYYRTLTEKKLKERPQDPAAWVEWMLTLDERGEWDEAFSAAQEATKKFAKEFLVLEVGYRVACHAGEYDHALVWINRLLELDPTHQKARAERVIPLLYLGRWEECVDLCKELLSQDPDHFIAHLHLGIISFEKKQWASAQHHLQQAYRIRPNDEFLKSALQKIPV
jgi:glycosyltransferase involved in cell wall biosynthesis